MANAAQGRVKVFIAYDRDDSRWARQLQSFLADAGFEAAADADSADAVAFVATDASVRSGAREVEHALAQGKRVLAVLPRPLAEGSRTPRNPIQFFDDDEHPDEGWHTGAKKLAAALRADADWLRTQTALLSHARRWNGGADDAALLRGQRLSDALSWRQAAPRDVTPPQAVDDFLRASAQRETRARAAPALAMEVAAAQRNLYPPLGPEPPVRKRGGMMRLVLLLALVGAVVFAATNGRAQLTDWYAQARSLLAELQPPQGPTGPEAVAAEAYVPLRAAFAGRSGANVRDYPLLSGDLVANLPAGTPLHIHARLNIQGNWWFRVRLDDGRVGFVREDVVRWGPAVRDPLAFPVTEIEPALAGLAGPDGANIRVGPSLDARALVRLRARTPVSITGKLQQDNFWWARVALDDGRIGFARHDVLTNADGTALVLTN